MKEVNKNTELSDTDKKLHISDVSCSVCGLVKNSSIGHSFTWTGVYDIERCGCGVKLSKKHYN